MLTRGQLSDKKKYPYTSALVQTTQCHAFQLWHFAIRWNLHLKAGLWVNYTVHHNITNADIWQFTLEPDGEQHDEYYKQWQNANVKYRKDKKAAKGSHQKQSGVSTTSSVA